jgi:hypothetical protein
VPIQTLRFLGILGTLSVAEKAYKFPLDRTFVVLSACQFIVLISPGAERACPWL